MPMPSPIRALLLLAPLALILPAAPALAKVLAEGPVKGGYYWQKIETNSGKVRYLCRSTSDSKIQKGAKCTDARAVKPE